MFETVFPEHELFASPQHPYTNGLLGAIPRPSAVATKARLREIPGRVPSLAELPQACAFAPRFPRADDRPRSQVPGLGIATVYRAIKQLLDDGFLSQVDLPGEPPRYEVAGKEHHHHFRCPSCKKVYDLDQCTDSFKQHLPRGFKLDGHELYLFGRCAACLPA